MKSPSIARRYILGVLLIAGLSNSLTGCRLGRALLQSVSLNDFNTQLKNNRESQAAWMNATGGSFDGTWADGRK